MTTSTPSGGSKASRNARVSAGPLNIFQLPAISICSFSRDHRDAGELPALEQLERGAAAGRDPGDSLVETELVDGADGVAAADDGVAVHVRNRLGDGLRAAGE